MDWHIDPHKVGVLGISAGGYLVIALNPTIKSHISSQTPPTFLLQNEDDDADSTSAEPPRVARMRSASIAGGRPHGVVDSVAATHR
jgi:hypothetical protein